MAIRFGQTKKEILESERDITDMLRQHNARTITIAYIPPDEAEAQGLEPMEYFGIEFWLLYDMPEKDEPFSLKARFVIPLGHEPKYGRGAMRCLFWLLDAKFAAAAYGINTMLEEFLPYIVTDAGQTVWQHAKSGDLGKLLGTGNIPMIGIGK